MDFCYITTGTPNSMELIHKKYANENMSLMFNDNEGILYHETKGKSVFQVPRKYEVIDWKGEIPESGLALFHYIPTTEDFRPNFEHQLLNQPRIIDTSHGFLAVRVLRPIRGHSYVIVTFWKDRDSLDQCQENEVFMEQLGKEKSIEVSKVTNYAGQSYMRMYIIGEFDNIEENS